jgi:hypothetical protein
MRNMVRVSRSTLGERRLTIDPGPVVRINPNEVHIKDSSMYHAYESLYKQS